MARVRRRLLAPALLPVLLLALADAQSGVSEDYMMEEAWVGPERGCSREEAVGVLHVSCAGPRSRFTLSLNSAPSYVKLELAAGGALACAELEQARAPAERYMRAAALRRDVTLELLQVVGASLLPGGDALACAAHVVGARGARKLVLEDVRGELLAHHLRGLEGVEILRMNRVESNMSAVPWAALASLPALRGVTVTGGALRLWPPAPPPPRLPRLAYLELSMGALQRLPARAFAHLPNLTMLSLFSNHITHVDVDAFAGLNELVNVSLNQNNISSLPTGVFEGTPRLQRVDLYDNPLAELARGVLAGLARLAQVMLFNNRAVLRVGAGALAGLPALATLHLNDAGVEALPGDAFAGSPLRTLNLRANRLRRLPAALLRALPLEELSLAHNALDALAADQFAGLARLRRLDLRANNLTDLPPRLFADLTDLEYLNLNDNQIEKLDDAVFARCARLRELQLRDNRLALLAHAVFRDAANLQVVNLAGNGLTVSRARGTRAAAADVVDYERGARLYQSPLWRCSELRVLDLSRNNVSLVADDWLQLYHLQHLNLSHNAITHLTDMDTSFPTNATVDFSHNRIQYLDLWEFPYESGTQELPTLVIDANPFNCSCGLYPLVHKRAQAPRLPRLRDSEARCAAPPALAGVPLRSLRAPQLTCAAQCPPGPALCAPCLLRPAELRAEYTCRAPPESTPPLPAGYTHAALRLLAPPAAALTLPSNVTHLDLRNLDLTAAPSVVTHGNASVTIDLRNNRLETPPVALLEKNYSLYLENNSLECSCRNRDDIVALVRRSASVRDWSATRCGGVAVASVDASTLCAERDLVLLVCVLVLAMVLALALLVAYYTNRTLAHLLARKFCWWAREADPTEARFDAFVSYAQPDEKFVRERLAPNLERLGLRLCLHERDWRVGGMIAAQIETSVAQSRRTIVVLSRAYVSSRWCALEFRVAHARGRALLLLLEEAAELKPVLGAELRAYLASSTYVRSSDACVWPRLRDAVLRRDARDKLAREPLDANFLPPTTPTTPTTPG